MNFVHLHTHTDYSLLDGACKIGELTAEAARLGMPAVAITDHGNLFGAVHFATQAAARGVKPIIGCEVYVAPGGRKHRGADAARSNHLVLLAENDEGYKNIIQLVSTGFLDGFYYKPRIDHELLAKHSKGLIALSGCLSGEVPEAILAGSYEQARTTAYRLRDIFGEGNFFLEVQDQGLKDQAHLNRELVKLSRETAIPLVATNDCHYLRHADARAHEVLLCIQTRKTMSDSQRLRFATDQFYFKSADEMARVFQELPDALQRTVTIAERCNVSIRRVEDPFPKFRVPEGYTTDSYFEKVVREGFASRLSKLERLAQEHRLRNPLVDYARRLDDEIKMIQQMRLAGYFLIVSDYIHYAHAQGIPVGPGRGSAAGSLVSYALHVTDVDPIEHNLLFERFLNPGRVSMPDIDTDFCMRRRGEVIDYVRQKYGEANVAQIITFGTMGARGVLKDTARALDMPYADGDRLAKLVPNQLNITLEEALKRSPELASARARDQRVKELINIALRLEGGVRHASTHAAGVVISPQPLVETVPFYKSSKDEITTQYDMNALESIGLLKMDFLGLATLTVMDDAVRLIKQHRGVHIDLTSLPLDDAAVYMLFSRGETIGIFQFESDGMRDILRRYQPSRLEDLTALNALYRPGPIQGRMIDDFIAGKHGKQKVVYEVPALEEILAETYGVIVYQEQVMQIANRLAGFSLAESDILRRAMAKKHSEQMTAQREKFLSGCQANQIPLKKAGNIFELMAKFAEYGFNKAHACAYALVAYQTAYLKCHYPVEYMAALLISETGKAEQVSKYINEARRMGIALLPPDVNSSDCDFTPARHQIRFGLTAIKNLSENAAKEIVHVRSSRGGFSSLSDFCDSLDIHLLNKSAMEAIVKAGAFDSLGLKRAQMMTTLSEILKRARRGMRGSSENYPRQNGSTQIPEVVEWSLAERLAGEKEALGLYVTGHPLDEYKDRLGGIESQKTSSVQDMADNTPVILVGLLTKFTEARSKKGNPYARAVLEDFCGSVELLVFERPLERFRGLLNPGSVIVIGGRVHCETGACPKVFVEKVDDLPSGQVGSPQIPQRALSSVTLNEEMPATKQDLCLRK